MIQVDGPGRQYTFTNKEAGTYYGEVDTSNTGGWEGWFVNTVKLINDYDVRIGTSSQLHRSNARSLVYPYKLVRMYPDSTVETFVFMDSINAIIVCINKPDAQMTLHCADGFIESTEDSLPPSFHHWVNKTSTPDYIPSVITLYGYHTANSSLFVVYAGNDISRSDSMVQFIALHGDELVSRRKLRMQHLLDRSFTETDNHDLTKALAWAKLSVDALIMNQSTGGARVKGIFAGLPWFNNYWGRDSFISLPGATYVTGNDADARAILLSFARFQNRDSTSKDFGRIPNLATPSSVIYNTADGTPWFVRSLYEYVKYSGDFDILRKLYPVIERSINGTLQYHTDSLGFLTHGDAETWMDAVGPNGPWSPRGNRACDIQALWWDQLTIGTFISDYLNEFRNAARWSKAALDVEQNFMKYFIDHDNGRIYDHLSKSGVPSRELRPNQLFCIDMPLPEDIRENIVRTVIDSLVFPYGTSTLSQSDSNFHPFHEDPPYYVKDAAYHNGTVWTWLNGQVTYAATRYDLQNVVFPVAMNSVHQILHRGCVGTLSELLDAHPRKKDNEPKLSGTFSQAWSLAEFIRSFYQDYLGVSIDVSSNLIRINPKLPHEITTATFSQRIGKGSVTIHYAAQGDTMHVTVTPVGLTKVYHVSYLYVFDNGNAVSAPVELSPNIVLRLVHTDSTLTIYRNGVGVSFGPNNSKIFLKNFSDKKNFPSIALAHPDLHRNYPVLRGPSYPLLTNEDVRKNNTKATLLWDASDPVGDDTGSGGTYQYPTNPAFKPGILDITNATFRYDDQYLYCSLKFANLSDPGWHPEYGFQLTLAAIAIDRGLGGSRTIGLHSQYVLDSTMSYDRLIVVGGGIRLLDDTGAILCEYLPRPDDVTNPIGNIPDHSVVFSIPLRYLGIPSQRWKIAILVGAQDDHGGAGVGEFRTVGAVAAEWSGGGKTDPHLPNVYDQLIINTR